MPDRTCSIDGCEKAHRARGLCASHWNATYRRDQHRTVDCSACGQPVIKNGPGLKRRTACSQRCRYWLTWGRWPETGREIVGPVPRAAAIPQPEAPRRTWVSAHCPWCSRWFISTGSIDRFCSRSCARSWHRKDWKVRTNRIIPSAIRALVYQRDNGICQLCFEPVDMLLPPSAILGPTLDHIQCQSWTLVPDHSAANLRLAHRLCNSLRGDGP